MNLKIRKRQHGSYEIIKVIGEAASDEVYKLSKAMEEAREKGIHHIAVDLSEASFLDSSALGVLILNLKMAKKENGDLKLLYPTAYVREILANANLTSIFALVENEEDLA